MSLVVVKASEAEAKTFSSLPSPCDAAGMTKQEEIAEYISRLPEDGGWYTLPCPVNDKGKHVGEYNWRAYRLKGQVPAILAESYNGIGFEYREMREVGKFGFRRTASTVKVTAPVK